MIILLLTYIHIVQTPQESFKFANDTLHNLLDCLNLLYDLGRYSYIYNNYSLNILKQIDRKSSENNS